MQEERKPKGMRWYQYVWLVVGLALAKAISANIGIGILTVVLGAYLCAFVIIFAISKVMKKFPKPMTWATVLQAGHLIWFIAGVAVAPQKIIFIIPDFILITGGLIWLLFMPRLAPVLFLAIYNGISIFKNVWEYNHSTVFSQEGLILNILLSLFTIFYLIYGLINIRRNEAVQKTQLETDRKKELPKEKGLCLRCGTKNPPDAFRCQNEDCSEILPQV